MLLLQKELKSLFDYDPETGLFTRKVKTAQRVKVGDVAGYVGKTGYSCFRFDGKLQYAHRLAFLWMTGEIPKYVDHINNIKSDNRWSNLRRATWAENNRNTKKNKNNRSGVKGVSWSPPHNKWAAYITVNNVKKHIGLYPDLIGAELAVRKARTDLHGEFANHGWN